jgi:helicase associated protein
MPSKKQKLYSERTWQKGFSALKKFKGREKHCRVPRHHLEGTFKLGQWVAVQRYSKDILAPKRKARLNALGFMWNRNDWLWQRGFAALKAFKAREGHCQVPASHIEGDLKLGYWVSTQRRKKNIMSKEHKRRLNKIGFVWRPKKVKRI